MMSLCAWRQGTRDSAATRLITNLLDPSEHPAWKLISIAQRGQACLVVPKTAGDETVR
ncbi:MAG: hypothetical protein HY814_11615 [Candidatus Riflebacteria bacterium]|nr:hypothetical protein [Candidatus Riflebacteria bacterium]